MDRSIVPSLVAAVILATGCAAPKSSLTSADYQDRAGRIRKVGVVVAEGRIMDLGAGGGVALNPEATKRCTANTAAAAKQSIEGRGYEVVLLPLDDDTRALLSDYMKVRGEITMPFPSNQGKIEGLPPLAAVPAATTRSGADAIVFVGALDHVSTGGRKAMMGALLLLGWSGGHGNAFADLAVVDGSGRIIFYDRKFGSNYTLTEDDDVQKVVGNLVAGLPLAPGK